MKTLLLSFTCLIFSLSEISAQIPLCVNPENLQYSIFTGSRSDSTDNCGRGVVTLTATGPLRFSVTPPDLVIFELESKTWNGSVYPDLDNVPQPGQSANGQLQAAYSITFCRPQAAGLAAGQSILETWNCVRCPIHSEGGMHEKITETGTKRADFIVHVMKLVLPDTIKLCGPQRKRIQANIHPANAVCTWEVNGAAITQTNTLIQNDLMEVWYDINVPEQGYGDGYVEVEMKACNLTMKKRCYVKMPARSPAAELRTIDSILGVALPIAHARLSGIGLGWIGNVTRLGPHCDKVFDTLARIMRPMLAREKFCHYHLGSLFDAGSLPLDIAAHIYLGVRDMNGRIRYIVDPWRYGDVSRRTAAAGDEDNDFTPLD